MSTGAHPPDCYTTLLARRLVKLFEPWYRLPHCCWCGWTCTHSPDRLLLSGEWPARTATEPHHPEPRAPWVHIQRRPLLKVGLLTMFNWVHGMNMLSLETCVRLSLYVLIPNCWAFAILLSTREELKCVSIFIVSHVRPAVFFFKNKILWSKIFSLPKQKMSNFVYRWWEYIMLNHVYLST